MCPFFLFLTDYEAIFILFFIFYFIYFIFDSVNDGQTSCTTKDNPIALWLILRVSKNKKTKTKQTKKTKTTKKETTKNKATTKYNSKAKQKSKKQSNLLNTKMRTKQNKKYYCISK